MFSWLISRLRFLGSEEGSAAVSWLVLTVSALSVLLSVLSLVSGGVENLARDTGNAVANAQPGEGVPADPGAHSPGDGAL